VGAPCTKAKLAVVLESAAADCYIFASESCAAGISVFEDTILDGKMIAGEFDGALLSAICGVSKANTFDGDIIALDAKDTLANRSFNRQLTAADVLIIVIPDVETFAVKVGVESPPSELVKFEDLTERVAVDKNLLAPADKAMVVVVGMRIVPVPRYEFVRPGRAVNLVIAFYFGPFADSVGARHNHACSGGGLKRDGIARQPALFDFDSFAVDAAVNNHRIARLGERRGLANCSHLFPLLDAGRRFSGNMPSFAFRRSTEKKSQH